jgi:phosphopantothenoylcysteine decarboxylase/phosphopantothenate--cysteine ligase
MKENPNSRFKIILGITGGIAAYKSAALVRLLQNANCEVRVVMTESATKFVSPLTFEALSGHPVALDDFAIGSISHIELAKWADIIVIAPATANTIAKIANGFADNLLTSIVLAFTKPIAIFPAMNTNMYLNEATKANINKLKQMGFNIFEPVSGRLACGDEGTGKMPEPEDIVKSVIGLTNFHEYAGINILVTAGPTIELIDPARYITNRSSGKMGYAVAAAAARKGANVTLISGAVPLTPPVKDVVNIQSSADMLEAVYSRLPAYDILLMCAAVSDYKPSKVAEQKIKKDEGVITLELIKTDDILKTVSVQKRPHQVDVGFAAESENVQDNAMKKLISKRLDMIVANDISRRDIGFNVDENEVTIYYGNSKHEFISKRNKSAVADIVVERAIALFKEKSKK